MLLAFVQQEIDIPAIKEELWLGDMRSSLLWLSFRVLVGEKSRVI